MSWEYIIKGIDDELQTALKEYHEFSDRYYELKVKEKNGLQPNEMENHFKEVKEVITRINELVTYMDRLLDEESKEKTKERFDNR
tara:strand:+ start:38 stop:292 length:255 start_codon:yes stop_codon:yes gene_type:complete